MKGLGQNVRSTEVSDLERCPLVQVSLYFESLSKIYLVLLNGLHSL